MDLYVGTSGFSYKEWKGTFYPSDLSPRQMLRFYSGRFPAVEINNTFYRMPSKSIMKAWASEVPERFKFVLKAPRQITHILQLTDAAEPVAHLLDVVNELGNRLGPLLFQLPPSMEKDVRTLRTFLTFLPARYHFAFEFRNRSWFDDEVFGLLREHGAALCIAESDDGLNVPCSSTSDWGYLRLRRRDYEDGDLLEWARRIASQDWKEAYVFFKHEEEGKGPKLAKRFMELAER
jgi:uncharacterized protein YecE (DUF72 family)